MVATLGKPVSRSARLVIGLAFALLWVIAVGPFSSVSAQTSQQKRAAMRANSPFNLGAGPTSVLQANLVQCGLDNSGNVCTDIFNSPTGGGGYWPSGTTNQYIFNSGMQVAGINSTTAGPWSGDTVGAYFFDARGTQPHGTPLTSIYNSLVPQDLANWPSGAIISDTSLFNAALIGSKTISDQDSYVEYWDGDPSRNAARDHPMGIKVQQRSLAFNAPAGAENTLFFIYTFTNVTNDPTFQSLNEAAFKVNLPDAGWTINNIYADFAMDADVDAAGAGNNFSTAFLPLNLGMAYHAQFEAPDFNFVARADLYAPPFFQGPGFVGVKYLKSPVNPATHQQVGLTMFSNTTNGNPFPDPVGVKQLFRYMKGDTQASLGDPVCTIPNSIQRRLCALVQTPADTRFFEASGPFSLAAGQSATIVVAYTHAAPVKVPQYTVGNTLAPGIPSLTTGIGGDTIRTIERVAGLIQVPQSAVVLDANGTAVGWDQSKLVVGRDFVARSLVHNSLIAQSIFNNKFLLPRPPESPKFSLVPGDNQVTVVWQPSATDVGCVEGTAGKGGDPYFGIASDPSSPLYNPNYRRCDVEGYRIYRATGLSGGFDLIAQFDKAGDAFSDVTCELDPTFVPEEGQACNAADVPLNGDVVFFREGGRVRNAVTGSVNVLPSGADTLHLEDTGIPFAYVDKTVRNGITYRYIVTAFDVNSLKSGAASLESPRQPLFTTPRKDPTNMVFASFSSSVTNNTGAALPNIPDPTVDSGTGEFSGPQPPSNGLSATFSPLVERLLPAFNLKATIDSIVPYTEDTSPNGCSTGENSRGACWRAYMTFDRDGVKSSSVSDGFSPFWVAFGDPVDQAITLGSGSVPPDATAATQFGLPSGFPGFKANVVGTFPEAMIYSATEGQTNRRDAGTCPNAIYPGFGCGNRHAPGGSRWFSGANETTADPAALIRVGHITGVDTVWAPIHHSPTANGATANNGNGYSNQYPASGAMQCFSYFFAPMARAADVKFTWGASGAVTVQDVTHNTPEIFKPTVQASYGFLNTDANGNGVIDWDDFNYISNVSPAVDNSAGVVGALGLGCNHVDSPATRVSLEASAKLNDVSVAGVNAPGPFPIAGKGFGLYINGERYIFALTGGALPASGATWTLRTYTGILRGSSATLTDNPSGYSWRGDVEPRQPMVTGLTFNASSSSASGPQGDVDITKVHTVPDPYYVRSEFELGPSNKVLRFVNLPPQAIIRIYSLNGTLVRIIEHNDAQGGAEESWDLRNRNNQFVASGVYFYVVEGPGGKKFTNKMTIVQFAR